MSSGTNTRKNKERKINLRVMVQVGMLGAVAVVLMMFEFALPFAPNFYKIDLSEVPVLIGAFAMGPIAAAFIELIKVVLHMLFKGSTTAGVGDFANFLIGCALVVPAGAVYRKMRSRKGAAFGMMAGIAAMTVVGSLLNMYVLLPVYAKVFGIPVAVLVEMGTAVNSKITNLTSFVLFAVVPFNLLKGVVVSVITFFLYKHISPIFKRN